MMKERRGIMRMVTKKDILEALGMETEDRFMTGLLIGVGLGALVGGITSLLLAPKRGSELREDLGSKMKDVVGKARLRLEWEEVFIAGGTTTEPRGV
jgi:hypothetical protein